MSDTEKVFTYEEVKALCHDAFDVGSLYARECARYGVDAIAYGWKSWLDKHGLLAKQLEGKDESSAVQIRFNPFDMGTTDDKARKVCEEAMEFYAEHFASVSVLAMDIKSTDGDYLRYEIGDVLTAMLNYCHALGIDPQECIDRVEEKNRNRGRYEKC